MSVPALHTPLAELNGDVETIGDNPAWMDATDADIRADVRQAIRAMLIGAAAALILVGCIALFQSVILWRL